MIGAKKVERKQICIQEKDCEEPFYGIEIFVLKQVCQIKQIKI